MVCLNMVDTSCLCLWCMQQGAGVFHVFVYGICMNCIYVLICNRFMYGVCTKCIHVLICNRFIYGVCIKCIYVLICNKFM